MKRQIYSKKWLPPPLLSEGGGLLEGTGCGLSKGGGY